jgi:serine/threonine-protein kinase
MHRESDLQFALTALRLGLASRDEALAAVAAWAKDPAKTPADSLPLTPSGRRAVDAMLEARSEIAAGDDAVAPDLARALLDAGLPPRLMPPVSAAGASPDGRRYRLGAEIGRGGLGRVVEAVDSRLGRDVAVKLLLAGREGQEDRFEREARLTARLDHPHVVPVHDFGQMEGDGALYLTMKRIRGRDLGSLIGLLSREDEGAVKAWSRAKLLGVFQDICLGVAYAHSKGVIHRDLKPSNVMLGDFGETLIVDWGLAKVLGEAESPDVSVALRRASKPEPRPADAAATLVPDSRTRPASSTLTVEGDVLGTPAYMPPEQAEGRITDMDARSDIWSLGAILYELLTHRTPFEAETLGELIARVRAATFTPPSARVAAVQSALLSSRGREHAALAPVPQDLDAVVARAMAPRREDRYSSALDLHHDIQQFLEGVKERERRAQEARDLISAGSADLETYVGLGSRIVEEADRLDVLQDALRHTLEMPPRTKAWAAEHALRQLEASRIEAFSRANAAFSHALVLAPDSPEALEGKCRLFATRYLDAERRRDRPEMLFQWNALAQYDRDGRHRADIQSQGKLVLRTFAYACRCLDPVRARGFRVRWAEKVSVSWEGGRARPDIPLETDGSRGVPALHIEPEGTRFGHRTDCPLEEIRGVGVSVSRYEEKDHRFVPGPDTLVGSTPLEIDLPRGSYRCVLTPPPLTGLTPVIVPVRVERKGVWRQDVRLYTAEAVPPGHLQVAGGPWQSGGPRTTTQDSFDFFVSRTHVTCAHYLEFLNALCAQGKLAEARTRLPRGTDRPYWIEEGRGKKARFRLPRGGEDPQLAWDPEWPVMAVSWLDAVAWCAWKSAIDGRVYSLPVTLEHEKASRGVDGRAYPWGDEPDATFAWVQRTQYGGFGPARAGSMPIDESPYGIRDLAGNVSSWCMSGSSRGRNDVRNTRGGAWSLPPTAGCAWDSSGLTVGGRRWFIGFRTVVRAMAFEEAPAGAKRKAGREKRSRS